MTSNTQQRHRDASKVTTCKVPRKINETLEFDAHNKKGIVKKKGSGVYVFRIEGQNERMRWGNRREICSDIKHFHDYGSLPPPSGDRW